MKHDFRPIPQGWVYRVDLEKNDRRFVPERFADGDQYDRFLIRSPIDFICAAFSKAIYKRENGRDL